MRLAPEQSQAALHADATCARILNEETGKVVFEVHAMQQVWVELSGEGARAHGPGTITL